MNVIRRVRAIVVDPRAEWPRIEHEPGDAVSLFLQYVAVLALIPALAGFIGAVLVGAAYPVVGTLRSPIIPALFGAIFGYVASFVVVLLLALIVDTLARRFGGQEEFRQRAQACSLFLYAGMARRDFPAGPGIALSHVARPVRCISGVDGRADADEIAAAAHVFLRGFDRRLCVRAGVAGHHGAAESVRWAGRNLAVSLPRASDRLRTRSAHGSRFCS